MLIGARWVVLGPPCPPGDSGWLPSDTYMRNTYAGARPCFACAQCSALQCAAAGGAPHPQPRPTLKSLIKVVHSILLVVG